MEKNKLNQEEISLGQAVELIEKFQGINLTKTLASMEHDIIGLNINELNDFCQSYHININFMASAFKIKEIAGQINVIIHASGILRSLPTLLEPDEIVQSVSLGAGNTGRNFDLETSLRIAEYKFIHWRGGSETIRQNALFKDFFELAEYTTNKRKYLYVIETEIPLKFFKSKRTINSVLSRYPALLSRLREKYGQTLQVVEDYYMLKKSEVEIYDISSHI